ncbi:MAG: hypothetical protein HZA34_00215 [Candidatus Pacebacteria bacterium]|nr:hypothetical protein [Candidatus Paceibacterota bacterium]
MRVRLPLSAQMPAQKRDILNQDSLRERLYTASTLKDVLSILDVLKETDGKVLIEESIRALVAIYEAGKITTQDLLFVRRIFTAHINRDDAKIWCSDKNSVQQTYAIFFEYAERAFSK